MSKWTKRITETDYRDSTGKYEQYIAIVDESRHEWQQEIAHVWSESDADHIIATQEALEIAREALVAALPWINGPARKTVSAALAQIDLSRIAALREE